jgi:hypothetical protein
LSNRGWKFIIAGIITLLSPWGWAEVSVWEQSISVTSKMVLPAMLDDFNDGADPNNWGGVKSTAISGVLSLAYDSVNAYGGSGYCLKADYSVPSAGNTVTLYMPVSPNYSGIDVSTYTYVSFMVKGTGTEKSFRFWLVSKGGGNTFVFTVNYSTITASWQEIKIPLSHFPGVDKTKLQEIDFIFDHAYLEQKGYPYTGTIYIDNILFKFN